MGVIILMLALYLIVLAFFILLNAISKDNPVKIDLVVESVNDGFSWKTQGEKSLDDDSQVSMQPVYEHISKEVRGILETYLALRDFVHLQKESEMFISMRPYRFFDDETVFLKPEMTGFFDELANMLRAKREGVVLTVDIRVASTDVEKGTSEMSTMELSGRRATLFTRALINRGVAAKTLSAAAVDGKRRGEIYLHFKTILIDEEAALEHARELIGDVTNVLAHPTPKKVEHSAATAEAP